MKTATTKNEVYGIMELCVSMEVESNQEALALFEAETKVNPYNVHMPDLTLSDAHGNVIGKVKVEDLNIEWKRFFND